MKKFVHNNISGLASVFAFLFVAVSLSSCEDPDRSYDGPPVIELANSIEARRSFVLSEEGVTDPQITIDSIQVNLVSAPLDRDITITWSLLPFDAEAFLFDDASTIEPQQGTQYTLPASNTITLPAGSNFAYIPVSINATELELLQPYGLEFRLESADVKISENYRTSRYIVVSVCPSEIPTGDANTYSGTVDFLGAPTLEISDVTILPVGISPIEYEVSDYVGLWYPTYQGTGAESISCIFRDICGDTFIEVGGNTEAFGPHVQSPNNPGTWDEVTQTLTLNWALDNSGGLFDGGVTVLTLDQ